MLYYITHVECSNVALQNLIAERKNNNQTKRYHLHSNCFSPKF